MKKTLLIFNPNTHSAGVPAAALLLVGGTIRAGAFKRACNGLHCAAGSVVIGYVQTNLDPERLASE